MLQTVASSDNVSVALSSHAHTFTDEHADGDINTSSWRPVL